MENNFSHKLPLLYLNYASCFLACILYISHLLPAMVLPTTVAAVRAGCGAAAPFDILPAVWISSLLSVSVGLLAARLLERVVR